jgi:hemerythrin superfamily protein
MNAIELLEAQHREIRRLLSRLEVAIKPDAKQKLFIAVADKLAIHAAIEERRFYPAVKGQQIDGVLLEALEEHLRIKRVLAAMLASEISDDSFDAKIKVLKEQVEHHVGEEEGCLFPEVEKLLAKDELEALGQAMSATASELRDTGKPRKAIPSEILHLPTL